MGGRFGGIFWRVFLRGFIWGFFRVFLRIFGRVLFGDFLEFFLGLLFRCLDKGKEKSVKSSPVHLLQTSLLLCSL